MFYTIYILIDQDSENRRSLLFELLSIGKIEAVENVKYLVEVQQQA